MIYNLGRIVSPILTDLQLLIVSLHILDPLPLVFNLLIQPLQPIKIIETAIPCLIQYKRGPLNLVTELTLLTTTASENIGTTLGVLNVAANLSESVARVRCILVRAEMVSAEFWVLPAPFTNEFFVLIFKSIELL